MVTLHVHGQREGNGPVGNQPLRKVRIDMPRQTFRVRLHGDELIRLRLHVVDVDLHTARVFLRLNPFSKHLGQGNQRAFPRPQVKGHGLGPFKRPFACRPAPAPESHIPMRVVPQLFTTFALVASELFRRNPAGASASAGGNDAAVIHDLPVSAERTGHLEAHPCLSLFPSVRPDGGFFLVSLRTAATDDL